MNWLTKEQRDVIRSAALQDPENETCGFVLESGEVVQCFNRAEDPVNTFEISPLDYALYEDKGIKGVWHSHIKLDGFSPFDQQVIASDPMPWAVYCLAKDHFTECNPHTVAPLLGRPYVFGVYDCYSVVSDKLQEMGVALPQWERSFFGEWNTPEFTPFDDQALIVGRPVQGDYQPGDILLFNLGDFSGHTDHIGVLINNRTFLHHPAERLSRIDRFGSWWKRKLRMAVRPHQLWKS